MEPHPWGTVFDSYPLSVYEIEYKINNGTYASFSPSGTSITTKLANSFIRGAIPGGPHHSTTSSGAPSTVISYIIFESEPITLYFRSAWAPSGSGSFPPNVIVTATITDITPNNTTPICDSGNCSDSNKEVFSWTFSFTNVIPSALQRTSTTSPDNTWIDITGDHGLQTCSGTGQLVNEVPFCYEGIPGTPPAYAGYNVTEKFGLLKADFGLDDLDPVFKAPHPTWTADDFVPIIFPISNPATFVFDNKNQFQDTHGLNSLLNPATKAAFTQAAVDNGKVMYHFSQDYMCNGSSILNVEVARRLTAATATPIGGIPQIRKKH